MMRLPPNRLLDGLDEEAIENLVMAIERLALCKQVPAEEVASRVTASIDKRITAEKLADQFDVRRQHLRH